MDDLYKVFITSAFASAKGRKPRGVPRTAIPGPRTNSNFKKKERPHRKWFNDDLHYMKNELRSMASKLNSKEFQFDIQLQEHYFTYRKKFKSVCKTSKSAFMKNLYNQLDALKNSNPKKFWEIYKDIIGVETKHKSNPIDASEWLSHFKELFNSPILADQTSQDEVNSYF